MKKLLFIVLCAVVFAGCTSREASETEHFVGYIYIVGNTLYINRVELTVFDAEGIYPGIDYTLYSDIVIVGLDDAMAAHMPSGYHTRHLGAEVLSFEITNETVFTFVDLHMYFGTDETGNRLYSTTITNEFLQYHVSNFPFDYEGAPLYRRIPYFISVRDGQVLTLNESFWLTM